MESKENIAQYRLRLDKTLASPDLAHEETLKTLVKNQMLRSSQCEVEECTDNVIEKRTNEVSNVLQMLRSASLDDYHGSKPKETSHIGWKVKQDTEEYRVMYREGPQGTPFHTLLVEGYVDGPVDVCLCISWESILYKKWWPQTVIPTFKILASECLQRVRIGEQISLVRMKVSWPLSTREAVVHFFVFEYFQDDLIVVLLNSISDLESVDRSTHGFTKDGIPDVHDVVRIDVVGGFAIQKVNAGRSYFRTLVNMDIKLDFVPPSFINFISRQLIGSGFRLYQKEVASVSKGDEDFGKVLRGPLYTRIREALYSDNYQNMSIDPENCDKESSVLPLEHAIKPVLVEGVNTDRKAFGGDCAPELLPEDNMGTDYKARFEIEEIQEIKIENNGHLEQGHKEIYRPTKSAESCCLKYRKKGDISAEVKHALETLENVISVIRECGLAPQTRSLQDLGNEELVDVGEGAVIKGTKSSEDAQFCSNSGVVCDESENKAVGRNRNEPRNSSSSIGSRQTGLNSYSEEANLNKIVPASPKENIPSASETKLTGFRSSNDETTKEPISDGGTSENKLVNAGDNNNRKILTNEGKNKRVRFCCLHFVAG